MMGYLSSPSDFDASEKDFRGLLSRLTVADKAGLVLRDAGRQPTAPVPAATAAPAAGSPLTTPAAGGAAAP
jgi:hypothetical protein